jgi:hypothetical protein
MVMDLDFQPFDQRLDLIPQPGNTLPAHYFGIEYRPDDKHRVVEFVVDDDVLLLLDRPQFLQGGI